MKTGRLSLIGNVRFHEALDLEKLRKAYEDGDQVALALAIHVCGQRGLVLPPWLTAAWEKGCYDIADREAESWDEVLANGKRKTAAQQDRELTGNQKKVLIVSAMEKYRQIPISRDDTGADRFSVIALDLSAQGERSGLWGSVSWREAKDLYYEIPGTRPPRKR